MHPLHPLLTLSLLLLHPTLQATCPSYICIKPTIDSTSNPSASHCILRDPTDFSRILVNSQKTSTLQAQICKLSSPSFNSAGSAGPYLAQWASTALPDSPPTWQPRYPGESCDTTQMAFKCLFGRRICYNGNCVGEGKGGRCRQTADCAALLYCAEDNKCRLLRTENESCKSDSECRRYLLCHKGGPNSGNSEGICKPFFSVQDGESKLLFLT